MTCKVADVRAVARCRRSTRGDYGVTPSATCASNPPIDILHVGRGQAMTTLNRIFTTGRLLQIIVILAATIAMKLMS